MTKEKILYNCLPDILPPNTTSISEVLTPKILLAMEEYAKQQVLNFNNWKEKNKYVFNGIYYSNKSPEIGVQTWFNIEELYSLFLKETAK